MLSDVTLSITPIILVHINDNSTINFVVNQPACKSLARITIRGLNCTSNEWPINNRAAPGKREHVNASRPLIMPAFSSDFGAFILNWCVRVVWRKGGEVGWVGGKFEWMDAQHKAMGLLLHIA